MAIGIMDIAIPARALADDTLPDFRNKVLHTGGPYPSSPDTRAETHLRRGRLEGSAHTDGAAAGAAAAVKRPHYAQNAWRSIRVALNLYRLL